jgi:hypothetical protein
MDDSYLKTFTEIIKALEKKGVNKKNEWSPNI